MKKFLTIILGIIIASLPAAAQGSLLATLSHEGNITSYYGPTALRSAYSASTDGDVITLSSGQFLSTNISKNITLRGAGCDTDSTTQRLPTVISGDFILSASADTLHHIVIEGIYHNSLISYNKGIKGAQIIKCMLKDFRYNSSSATGCSISFIQCRIRGSLYAEGYCAFTCINSFICDPYSVSSTTSNFDMSNCIIRYYNTLYSSTFANCIFYGASSNTSSHSTNIHYNCVYVNKEGKGSWFSNDRTGTNKYATYETMFKTFAGTYSDTENFKLTEAGEKFVGVDGTQVGIYGGMLPYETTPSNPQITKFVVAPKSTADGKLSVDITVSVNE